MTAKNERRGREKLVKVNVRLFEEDVAFLQERAELEAAYYHTLIRQAVRKFVRDQKRQRKVR